MLINRNKPRKIIINGNELLHKMDGMTRVAIEMVRRLDKMLDPGEAIVVVKDKDALASVIELKNIRVVERKRPSRKWTFINIDLYSILTGSLELGFRNRAGFAKGIYYLHDLIPFTFYGKTYDGNLKRMKKNARTIVTVSGYSKNEITRLLEVDEDRVCVIKNGWEHFKDIEPDTGIFDRYPELKPGQYFLSVGNISPHKNFQLIYEIAKGMKNSVFVIAGDMNRGLPVDVSDVSNLIFTGHLSGGETKALMMNCRAFIFPSLAEGMGIPPLEALSCRVPVCVSDIPVMHEIFGESVHYFDPCDKEVDLRKMINEPVDPPENVLNLLSWDKSAERLYSLIKKSLGKV